VTLSRDIQMVTLREKAFAGIDQLLSHAERATALLDRCRPINAVAELERVALRWEAGDECVPAFRYRPRSDFGPLLVALERIATDPWREDPLGGLYAGRAEELFREASIADALVTAEFTVDRSPHGVHADETARKWTELSPRVQDSGIRADDESDPQSLVSVVSSLVGELRLPVRVVFDAALASAAATGDGIVLIRPDALHLPSCARRIALHEVHGHAAPRIRARSESLGLFAVGTAQGTDDEEGRALLIEDRHGLLDDGRKRELGIRHAAALAARAGADWVELTRRVLAFGDTKRPASAEVRAALRVVARVLRGGGLAREVVYLPALHRVGAALSRDPSVERWLERGRVSVDAVRLLADSTFDASVGPLPSRNERRQRNVATTGA
jgi:hypothetical protein